MPALTGLYDTYVDARATVVDLEMTGVAPADIRLDAPRGENSYAPPAVGDTDAARPPRACRVTVLVEPGRVAEIDAILRRHASADPERREYDYTAGGWDRFDPHLPPDVRSPAAHRKT